jgi:hypothetical protein
MSSAHTPLPHRMPLMDQGMISITKIYMPKIPSAFSEGFHQIQPQV